MVFLSNIQFSQVRPVPPPDEDPPPPQPAPLVTFLHGLGENGNVWFDVSNNLTSELNINSYRPSYNSSLHINDIVSSDPGLVPSNSVVVAHSMGGLVARKLYQSYASAAALITIGTPHTGAPIASRADVTGYLLTKWIGALATPFEHLLGVGNGLYIAQNALFGLIQTLMPSIVNREADLSRGSVQDMVPGSEFLQNLNANPLSTLPTTHYPIYGDEDWQSMWRLLDAWTTGSGIESGNGYAYEQGLEYTYLTMWAIADLTGGWYFMDYLENYEENPSLAEYALQLAFWWWGIAGDFYDGYYVLANEMQEDWDRDMVGSKINGLWYSDDALIPYYSQAPDFVSDERKIQALHVNHREETTLQADAYNAVKSALLSAGVTRR